MLSGDFFDLQSFTCDDCEVARQNCTAIVTLNVNHPIYNGHFPDNPVVPGVCQIQMVKELAEKAVNQPLNLKESDNVKFLLMISPVQNPYLEINLIIQHVTEKLISVTASIASGASVFLKFKGKFEFAD